MSHTPKPWKFIPLIKGTNTQDEMDNVICSGNQLIAQIYDSYNPVADGNLMAAAPELLEALQFALERLKIVERESDYDHRTFHQGIAIDKAIAAINKATGKKR